MSGCGNSPVALCLSSGLRLPESLTVNSAACKTLTCVATNLAACATAELQTMSAETLSLALKSFVPLILGSVGPMAITSLPHQVSFKEGLRSTSARLPLCDYFNYD